jgi:hypothetical protein
LIVYFTESVFLNDKKNNNVFADLRSWSFVCGLLRNILHYFLIGRIGAELTMRLFWKVSSSAEIEEYSLPKNEMEKYFVKDSEEEGGNGNFKTEVDDNTDQAECFSGICKSITDFFQKRLEKIYKCDEKFRFTTVAICTYTVAYVFLFHLIGTLITLYTTQRKSYMHYKRYVFESLLNIGKFNPFSIDLRSPFCSLHRTERAIASE